MQSITSCVDGCRPFRSFGEYADFVESLGNEPLAIMTQDINDDFAISVLQNRRGFGSYDENNSNSGLVLYCRDGQRFDADWCFNHLCIAIHGTSIPFGVEE